MALLAALFLTTAASDAPTTTPRPMATAVARARIISAAEVRRINGRLEVRTGDRNAPTQVHRTVRHEGGETADFF